MFLLLVWCFLCVSIHAYVHACLWACSVVVYSFWQAYECVHVIVFFVRAEVLGVPAAVLFSSSIRRIIKGPGRQPIESAVIALPRWYGPIGWGLEVHIGYGWLSPAWEQ